MDGNFDTKTVEGFGEEWSRFDQTGMESGELSAQFGRYFPVFPWDELPENPVGFDLGCEGAGHQR